MHGSLGDEAGVHGSLGDRGGCRAAGLWGPISAHSTVAGSDHWGTATAGPGCGAPAPLVPACPSPEDVGGSCGVTSSRPHRCHVRCRDAQRVLARVLPAPFTRSLSPAPHPELSFPGLCALPRGTRPPASTGGCQLPMPPAVWMDLVSILLVSTIHLGFWGWQADCLLCVWLNRWFWLR